MDRHWEIGSAPRHVVYKGYELFGVKYKDTSNNDVLWHVSVAGYWPNSSSHLYVLNHEIKQDINPAEKEMVLESIQRWERMGYPKLQ